MIEIYILLLLVGLSMIFYVVIKNIKERKKEEEIQEIKDKEEILKHKLIGKFEVYKDKEGKYRFRLKAANGEIIAAASQGYSTKQSCLNGIKSVKKNAPEFEVYKDKEGKYRFRLKAANGEIIAAASQGYSTKQSCLNGIKSVKKNAPDAPIVEL